jgi:drug/metabolite transporter (DMT)-like permease
VSVLVDPPARTLSAKTLGVLAVVGLVVAFSLSSTLVKRAETPGVLVAFWRMLTVSLAWNAVLWSTGRRVKMSDVRRVYIPGILFGLNLAVFFAGATHNSVANAALIGSLAPFLIVPAGAVLFAEYIDPRALAFALLAFGGVALVSAVIEGPVAGWTSGRVLGAGAAAALLLALFVVQQRRAAEPLLDVRLFRDPRFSAASATIMVLFFALFGFLFLATQYLQFVLGYSPSAAGVRVLPYAGAMIVFASVSVIASCSPALTPTANCSSLPAVSVTTSRSALRAKAHDSS